MMVRSKGANEMKPPVTTGEIIELTVTGQSHTGDGVGKYEGFTVFVPLALRGERIRAKITKVKKTYAHGRMLEILEASPARTEPACPVFERCGGCQLQHVSYEEQLRIKRQQVIDSFQRIGGWEEEVPVLPVIGMQDPWVYRNKAQVPFGLRGGELVAGFYAAGTHTIVDMDTCGIQHPDNDRAVREVKRLAKELGIPPYDEKNHRGVLRHVMVRTGFATGEMMVVLVTNGKQLPHRETLVAKLRKALPRMKSLVQNINDRRTNVILGRENRLLWGEPVIRDRIGSVTYVISPQSFFQVNPVQTRVLYDQVRRYARLTGREIVMDVYCGAGTIGLYLADGAAWVYGVESVPEAIEDARRNARINGIEHVTFEAGKAEDVMPRWREQGIRPDVIVVDPPRKGCDPVLLDTVVDMHPKRLVYVSCNPATLARDARYLRERGIETLEVQPVDMFPHTSHVECVAWMEPAGKTL
jgi:23S rRNA (uracil1939-C5)-methyltransferase